MTTYTPFFRRFTNERRRELDEVQQLYAEVSRQQALFNEDATTIGRRVYPAYAHLSEPLRHAFSFVMYDVLSAEPYLQELPSLDLERMSLAEFVGCRNHLLAKQYFFANQAHLLPLYDEVFTAVFEAIASELPISEDPSPFTIPLVYALPRVGSCISFVYQSFARHHERGLFRPLVEQLYSKLCEASGRTDKNEKPYLHAEDSTLPLDKLVASYVGGTTWERFFSTPVPLKLTYRDRFHHTHIVGGSGAGKTTLIENVLAYDLASEDPPSLVVIDPHGDLIRKLTHADLGIGEKLILIDPRDIEHPPALNVFALNQERMSHYGAVTQEQVTAGVIQTFDYLFSGLIGADLTAKQSVFFRYLARLMLALPKALGRNATILDMLALMSDLAPYAEAIGQLPPLQREFFERDFNSKTFAQTKEQIRYRLHAILESPTLARLFTAPETKLDIFTALNDGCVILVDTAKDFLKDGSSTFGRLFISLVLQAVLERAAIPERSRKPTFLIVDEAASYFDSNIDDLLTEARKYQCGLVLAHQFLDQASHGLRASLAANTGTKFASLLSVADARSMAPEMRTTSDFILDQPPLQFACHIRSVTPQAVSIPVFRGLFEEGPQLSERAYAELIARNRARVSISLADDARPAPEAARMAPFDDDEEDESRVW